MGYLAISKHGYLCRKDVTASAKVVDNLSAKFPNIPDQYFTSKPVAKIVSDDLSSDHIDAIRFHPPLILVPPLDSSVPPALIEKNLPLLPNQAAPMPTYNGYVDLYSSDS